MTTIELILIVVLLMPAWGRLLLGFLRDLNQYRSERAASTSLVTVLGPSGRRIGRVRNHGDFLLATGWRRLTRALASWPPSRRAWLSLVLEATAVLIAVIALLR